MARRGRGRGARRRGEGGVDVARRSTCSASAACATCWSRAGPTLAASFVERGLVDRFVLYLAPKLIGGDAPGLLATA